MSAASGCTTLPTPTVRVPDGMTPIRMSCREGSAETGGSHKPASCGSRRLASLALVLVSLYAAAAGASVRWYTVEIIVFDDLEGDGLHAESWPADPGEPPTDGTVEMAPASVNAQGDGVRAFRLVSRAALSLNDTWGALRRSARYRPILHAGWRLRGGPRSSTRPARLTAHLGNDRDGPVVYGNVRVSLARYLQIELDLLYTRPPPVTDDAAAPADAIPTRFRLIAERRMRSRELHYIDHPMFGVLVLVTPARAIPGNGRRLD